MSDEQRRARHAELVAEHRVTWFGNVRYRVLDEQCAWVPLVAGRLTRSTTIFTTGQVVYVYHVFGEGLHARVVGRFRRKRRFVVGVCLVDALTDLRPKRVHHPGVLARLRGAPIDAYALSLCLRPVVIDDEHD